MIKERETIKKEIVQETEAFICDNCGKEHKGKGLPKDWLEFSHQHSDWGNDSWESRQENHVCSPKCFKEKAIWVLNREDYPSLEFDMEMSKEFMKRLIEES